MINFYYFYAQGFIENKVNCLYGIFPQWTNTMVGYSAVPVGRCLEKDLLDFDIPLVYEAVKQSAMQQNQRYPIRRQTLFYSCWFCHWISC